MGMSPVERQARHRAKQRAAIEALPKVPCQCGCGTLIPPINTNGKPATYAHGHNPTGGEFRRGQVAWNKGLPNPRAREVHIGKKLSRDEIAQRTATRLEKNSGVYQRGGWKMRPAARERVAALVRSRDVSGPNNPFYGNTHTEEVRRRISEANAGPANHTWNGGRNFLPYMPTFNRRFKALIRKRDGYRCRRCGATRQEVGRTLHVHHIDFSKTNDDPSNLITLCFRCHRVVHPQYRA